MLLTHNAFKPEWKLMMLLLFTCISLDFFCTVNIVNQKIKAHKSSLSLSSFNRVEMVRIWWN